MTKLAGIFTHFLKELQKNGLSVVQDFKCYQCYLTELFSGRSLNSFIKIHYRSIDRVFIALYILVHTVD